MHWRKGDEVRLDKLSTLLSHDGPYASVLVDVSRATEDAAHLIELTARSVRTSLVESGAPEKIAEVVVDRLDEPARTEAPAGRFVVGTADGVLVNEVLPHWSGATVNVWGPLPDVTAWLTYHDAATPVLVVVADKSGADLYRYAAWGHGDPTSQQTVSGDSLHLNKVADGGIGRTDLQRPTEEVWRRNARQVADELDRAAGQHPPLIVLSGDPRARHEILQALHPHLKKSLVEAEHGSRAPGSSEEALENEILHVVRSAVVERRLGVVRELQERVGRRSAVALGAREVLDAFELGQVETVLVDPDRAARQDVRPDEHPGLPLPASARRAERLRADLTVLAAAAATSAEAVFVGSRAGPEDGVAALLRWEQ